MLIAQELGAGQKEELNSSIGTLFSILGILSVVLAVGSIMGAGVILRMLNVPVQSYSQAWVYLVITSAGLPLVFGYNAVCSVLRGWRFPQSAAFYCSRSRCQSGAGSGTDCHMPYGSCGNCAGYHYWTGHSFWHIRCQTIQRAGCVLL